MFEKETSYKKVEAQGDFKTQFSFENFALKDNIREEIDVTVCKNVEVFPKFKSLYVGSSNQDFKLSILHGTGHFSVTFDNTDLITDYNHKGRDIYFKPAAPGTIEVKIEDIELPDAQPAFAEIVISDIGRLTMSSPQTLLEEGDSV